jgi:iron-sulfur cluster assembly accessory protein
MSVTGKVISAVSSSGSKRTLKAAIELTEAATKRLQELFRVRKEADPVILGIRLGVKKRGCSGLSYTLDYAREVKPSDTIVQGKDVTVYIDPQALLKVIGTKMDFVEDDIERRFVFVNPNAKSICGCQESFNTEG